MTTSKEMRQVWDRSCRAGADTFVCGVARVSDAAGAGLN